MAIKAPTISAHPLTLRLIGEKKLSLDLMTVVLIPITAYYANVAYQNFSSVYQFRYASFEFPFGYFILATFLAFCLPIMAGFSAYMVARHISLDLHELIWVTALSDKQL